MCNCSDYYKFIVECPGESWISDFIAVIGIFAALAIYLHQRKSEKNKEIEKEKNSARSYLNFTKHTLQNIVKSTKTQIDETKQFIKLVKEQPYEVHDFRFIASEEIDRFLSADSFILLRSLVIIHGPKSELVEKYKEIYSSLDLINTLIKQMRNIYEKYNLEVGQLQKQYTDLFNRTITDLLVTRRRIVRELKKEANNNLELKFIENMMNKRNEILKTKNYSTKIIHDDIFEPVFEYYLTSYSSFSNSEDFIIKFKTADQINGDIFHASEVFADYYDERLKLLVFRNDEFEKFIEQL